MIVTGGLRAAIGASLRLDAPYGGETMRDRRQWTISWTTPSDPGTGGVYIDGPVLKYGDSITVIEAPCDSSDSRDGECPTCGHARRTEECI